MFLFGLPRETPAAVPAPEVPKKSHTAAGKRTGPNDAMMSLIPRTRKAVTRAAPDKPWRRICARTAAAQAVIDAFIADADLPPGPPMILKRTGRVPSKAQMKVFQRRHRRADAEEDDAP